MLGLRRGIVAVLFSSLVAVAPAAAAPITVSQLVQLNQVQPFGTFTNVTLTPGAWTGNPFPFTLASEITQIKITFDSTDSRYVNNVGPSGGTTWTAVYAINDALSMAPIASVDHGSPTIFLTAVQGSFFTTVRDLLLDGQISFALGAYESVPGHTNALTLNGPSTFRVEVTGDAPLPAPEPTSLVLLATGLLPLRLARRRGLPLRRASIASH